VADLDIAVKVILGTLILPEELGDVFVRLHILGFEFLKPFFSLLGIKLLQ